MYILICIFLNALCMHILESYVLSIIISEGNGASFPIHGSMNVGYLMSSSNGGTRSNHVNDQDGLVIVDKGGSESEVEIYAVDDQMQETHLLAAT